MSNIFRNHRDQDDYKMKKLKTIVLTINRYTKSCSLPMLDHGLCYHNLTIDKSFDYDIIIGGIKLEKNDIFKKNYVQYSPWHECEIIIKKDGILEKDIIITIDLMIPTYEKKFKAKCKELLAYTGEVMIAIILFPVFPGSIFFLLDRDIRMSH